MDPKGLLLAGAVMLAPAFASASSHLTLHPANPGAETAQVPFTSPFQATVPLLDRQAPHPSYGPAPDGTAPAAAAPTSAVDHSAMGHGAMDHGAAGHGAMNHGTATHAH